jgi:hypothetical protein
MARCNSNGRGDATLSMSAHYNGKGLMGACCEGKGHIGRGIALSMVRCNGNGGGCADLLMARRKGNSRGHTLLSIGARYTGKGSGCGGAWRAAMQDDSTQNDCFSTCAKNRWTNDNQPAMGVDKQDVGRRWPGQVGAREVCNDNKEEKEDGGSLSIS